MQFESIFRNLYGKPCWGVKPGHGSFLTLEFGEPHLEIREPIIASKNASPEIRAHLARRRVYVHGQWHLWINCCNWQVFSGTECVGSSSSSTEIRRAAEFLDGQALTRFSISLPGGNCEFQFDLGASLRTQPYDTESEQWLLFEPSRTVLILRADGRYKHGPSDVPADQGEWRAIACQQATTS